MENNGQDYLQRARDLIEQHQSTRLPSRLGRLLGALLVAGVFFVALIVFQPECLVIESANKVAAFSYSRAFWVSLAAGAIAYYFLK